MQKFILGIFLTITLSCGCSNNSSSSEVSASIGDVKEEKQAKQEDLEIESEEVEETEPISSEEQVKVLEMEVFDPDYINGKWEAEDQNGYSFGAWFDNQDGTLIGQYCAMNHDASRLDCGTYDDVKICYLKSGPVMGKESLVLEVISCYSEKKGRATIAPQEDGNLVWRLLEEPGEFEVDHFAPKVALLRKFSFDPYE